jgi:hypothetical protein
VLAGIINQGARQRPSSFQVTVIATALQITPRAPPKMRKFGVIRHGEDEITLTFAQKGKVPIRARALVGDWWPLSK